MTKLYVAAYSLIKEGEEGVAISMSVGAILAQNKGEALSICHQNAMNDKSVRSGEATVFDAEVTPVRDEFVAEIVKVFGEEQSE